MTEYEEDFKNNNNCRFCEKNNESFESDKVGDSCHLTSRFRGRAHSICKVIVAQDQISFIPFLFHNFSNYDFHMFFKKLLEEKNDKVKSKIIPKTNEEYVSVRYGCVRFIDSYQFLLSSLDSFVKIFVDNSHKTIKKFGYKNRL